MLSKELNDVIKSTKAKIIFFIIFLIPIIDLLLNVHMVYSDFWLHPEAYPHGIPMNMVYHPSKAAFLSGSSIGHMPQMLFIWLLPLFLLLIYDDSYIKECRLGYNNIMSTRINNKKIFQTKIITGFIVGFLVVFVSLVCNFLLACICFKGGKSFSGLEILAGLPDTHLILNMSLQHPIISYSIYIMAFSIIAGLYSAGCVSVSFIVKDYKLLYGICVVVWFLQILSPFSITYAMQPFIEYGLNKIIPAMIILLGVILVTVILGYYMKVKHERI